MIKVLISTFMIMMLQPAIGQKLVIANTKMNILYLGIDNPISFGIKNGNTKDIVLVPQRGEIHEYDGALYYINCKNEAGELKIYAKNKRTNKIIDSVLFRLLRLPDPLVRIVALHMTEGAYVGNNILEDFQGIIAYVSGDYEFPVQVLSYQFSITTSGRQYWQVINEGNKLTEETRLKLQNIKEGDQVVLENVKVSFSCNKLPRNLNFKIRLK